MDGCVTKGTSAAPPGSFAPRTAGGGSPYLASACARMKSRYLPMPGSRCYPDLEV